MRKPGPERVLLIASYPDSVLEFRGALLCALVAAGRDVHVGAPNFESVPRARQELESMGVSLHDIPLRRTGTNPFADLSLLYSLVRLMNEVRPDVVLPYTIKPVIYGTIAAWLTGVPNRFALVTGLGYAFTGEHDSVFRQIIVKLYKFALVRTKKVFFQNPDDRDLFRALGILDARVPGVVLNGSGVDLEAHSAFQPTPGPTSFLMIARLLGGKGVREYVEAARILRASYPGVTFALAGWIDDGPDAIKDAELRSWIEAGAVEYLGRLDDVRPALRACSVYVLPSYREGTPRTVLEAMATGRPIITTDVPGCRETVVEGANGLLVPVKSVAGLVAAMERLVLDAALREAMGRESRRIAEERYDVKKVNKVMLAEMGVNG